MPSGSIYRFRTAVINPVSAGKWQGVNTLVVGQVEVTARELSAALETLRF